MTAKDKFAKARTGLILDHPFFGSLALRLTPEEDSSIPTAATDGKKILYNPEFIDGLSLDETKGLIAHEVMHCANQHHTRRDERDMRTWNMACDYAINPLILGCGMVLPKGGLVDSQYDNMSAEQIYSRIPSDDPEGDKGDQDGKGNDPGGCGGIMDAPGNEPGKQPSKDELEQAAQDWKVALVQAATQAKAMGELPGAIQRIVADLVEPVHDWRELLRRFVDTNARNDYQWFPPNRRHVGNGMILPSLRSQELKNVTMALDTSGSISGADLAAFESEVRAIVEDYRADTTVIYCDSAVQHVEHFDADSPVKLSPKGGGGTDYRPVFEHIEQTGEYPVCLIIQTDGWCDRFPEEPPDCPVLWVLPRKNERFRPFFGETISL